MKRAVSIILKVAVSSALLAFLFYKTDTEAFLSALAGLDKKYLLYAACIFVLTQLAAVLRWGVVLSKDFAVPFRELFSYYFVGMFFSNFLPTLVGGDVVRGFYIYRKIRNGGVAAASVIMDRYTGYTALMMITTCALILGFSYLQGIGEGSLLPVFFAVIGAFVAGSAFLWVEKLHAWLVGILKKIKSFGVNEKVEAFYGVFMGFKRRPEILVKALVLSFVVQLGIVIGVYVLATGLHIKAPIWSFFLFVPLTSVAAMVPLSLAGLGFREGAFVFLFSKAGVGGAEALSLSLIWFFVTLFVSLIGAFEYLRCGSRDGLKDFENAGKS